ncbi:MAG: CpaF family protein [Chloroflexi bacterium]|nr:CpaF family protein [Chloroflexota bacterium]
MTNLSTARNQHQHPAAGVGPANGGEPQDASYRQIKYEVHQKLIAELDPVKIGQQRAEHQREMLEDAISQLLLREGITLPRPARQTLIQELCNEVLGFGPLEPLLSDPSISEIMVNTPNEVYVERSGVLEESGVRFRDDAHIMAIVDKILAPLNRRIDESSPMVDARLPSGYRVNVIVPPLALRGPAITIRKFFNDRFALDDMVRIGTLSQEVAEFLKACVAARLNILIAGGTGSGKTTLLNALSAFIPPGERVVTIEDPAELQLKGKHVVSLETRPPTIEGKHQVTQRELVVNALRMRPDRIIVGEVRAGEAFDMMQAMNTGHEGSICTVHANTPRDALARIENMVLMAGFDLPVRAIREQIASAIHLIVYIGRMRDGVRRITHVSEVSGMEQQTVTMQDLFVFEQAGIDKEGRILGRLTPTGLPPRFMERITQAGIELKPDLFRRPGGW